MTYSLKALASKLNVQAGAPLCRRIEEYSFGELSAIVGEKEAMALWEHKAAWHDAGCPEVVLGA